MDPAEMKAISMHLTLLNLALLIILGLVPNSGLADNRPRMENLGIIIESATLEHRLQYYLPLTNQAHLLLYYVSLEYFRRPFQLLDINLDTGATRVAEAVPGRPGPMASLLHANGLIYIGSGDPGYFMVYDPATGQSRQIGKLADKGAQYMIEGDDGAIYIGEAVRGMVERYDPKTGAWENYGIMDDPGPPYYRYAYTLGADGRYVYVAMGQNPWYLVIYDRINKSQKVYWKEQHPLGVTVYRGKDRGWFAMCKTREGKESWYALKGGQPEPLTVKPAVAPAAMTQLTDKSASPFEIDLDRAIPDTGNRGRVTVRWRRSPAQAWQETSAQLRMAPMDIKRLYATPDARLFGFTSFYGPVFTYDPEKRALTILGRPQRSLYDALRVEGDWHLAGYPAATMRFDPRRPWNLTASTRDLYGGMINPRLVKVAPAAAAKYHYYLALGADGYVYFGGHHERSGVGGSLGWYHPKTGLSGGLREPFLQDDVSDLIAVENGRRIVFSSHGVGGGLEGRIFIFDVQRKKLTGDFAPLPGGRDAGKLLEVAPGIIIGVVAGTPKSMIYRADLKQRRGIWKKEIEGLAFGSVRGFDRRLVKGPDGRIWLYLNNTICRLDPADGGCQEVMAAPPAGSLLFVGHDLYIYGGAELRKVSGILRTGEK